MRTLFLLLALVAVGVILYNTGQNAEKNFSSERIANPLQKTRFSNSKQTINSYMGSAIQTAAVENIIPDLKTIKKDLLSSYPNAKINKPLNKGGINLSKDNKNVFLCVQNSFKEHFCSAWNVEKRIIENASGRTLKSAKKEAKRLASL